MDLDAVLERFAELVAEKLAAKASANGNGNGHAPEPETLLTATEAVKRLGMTTRWLYAHADTLPFIVRVGRSVRCSAAGLERWIAKRQRGSDVGGAVLGSGTLNRRGTK